MIRERGGVSNEYEQLLSSLNTGVVRQPPDHALVGREAGKQPVVGPSEKGTGSGREARRAMREGASGERQDSGREGRGGGGEEVGAGAYDALAAARQDHAVIVAGLNTITGLLQGLREDIARQVALQEQQQLVTEQLLAAVQQERHLIDELINNGTNQGPGVAYAAQQQATVIDTETTDASQRWPSSAWEKIKAEVKKVLARLWSVISKLVTVKEWTLTGKVGTPGLLFGLAEASVSVTFGR